MGFFFPVVEGEVVEDNSRSWFKFFAEFVFESVHDGGHGVAGDDVVAGEVFLPEVFVEDVGVGESGFLDIFLGEFAELVVYFVAVGFDSGLGEGDDDASVSAAEVGDFLTGLGFGEFDHGGDAVAGGLEIGNRWRCHGLII